MMLVQVLVFWCLFAVPDIVKRDAVISTSRKFYFDLETEDKYAENVCVHVCVCVAFVFLLQVIFTCCLLGKVCTVSVYAVFEIHQ